MNHKKLVIMGIWIGLIVSVGVMGWELPLQQVSHPECKGIHRQELSDECKIALDMPMEQSMSELLISVLWGASYLDSHTPGSGSHPSADFVSTIGTPVYSMGEGEVITARYRAGYGNAITIRHEFEGDIIYSNYSHLSVMNVRPGQWVEGGVKIGEVGRSGFTMGPYGYHLDFQITTAQSPSHPYGFHDCEAGGYVDVVNNGRCRDKLERYTIDPLEFFANYAGSDLRPIGRSNPQEIPGDEEETLVAEVLADAEQNQISSIESINNEEIVPSPSIEQVVTEVPVLEDTVIIRQAPSQDDTQPQEIIKEHDAAHEDAKNIGTVALKPGLDVSWEVLGENAKVGNIIPIQFEITQDGEPVSGKLANRIRIQSPENTELLPGSFGRIYKGKKTVFVRIHSAGAYRLDVHSGEVQLGQIVLSIE